MSLTKNKSLNAKTLEMINTYDKWPDYCMESYKNAEPADIDSDKIVFCGMGGSGVVFDILSSLIPDKDIIINKGYFLPKNITNSLIVLNSASGNTIETLTALKSAAKTKNKVIAFSSGEKIEDTKRVSTNGKIERFCTKNKIPQRTYAMRSSPRASIPFSLYTILGTLGQSFGIKKNAITDSIKTVKTSRDKIFNNQKNNSALDLAKFIKGYPICYYSSDLFPVALRFRQDFQENCKKLAACEEVVESCHNSINSWENPSGLSPILLRGKNDHKLIKNRFEVWKEYFETRKLSYKEIYSGNGGLLTQYMELIYEMGMSTIYYAINDGTDPTLLKAIDFVKARV